MEQERVPPAVQEENQKPHPGNLEQFLPWVCKQMQIDANFIFHTNVLHEHSKTVESERNRTREKSKAYLPSTAALTSDDGHPSTPHDITGHRSIDQRNRLQIVLTYDQFGNLIGLKFDRNLKIPQNIMQIIGLVIKFQVTLNTITINRGLNVQVLHELCKFLPMSKITHICLDDCFLKECNYYILLENRSCLSNLSLSRCLIGDVGINLITARLVHPLPASKTLSILNLSTNRITDEGAKGIGLALRTNRKLVYLNLTDNMISDVGLACILNSLSIFPLTSEELLTSRRQNLNYLREKKAVITKALHEVRISDMEKISSKKKQSRVSTVIKKGKVEKELSNKNLAFESKLLASINYEKAEAVAMKALGAFVNPYSAGNLTLREDAICCVGNKSFRYLNVAYNRLSFASVKKILDVLTYQRSIDRRQRVGLVSVCLEGNQLPEHCEELAMIDNILREAFCNPSQLSISGGVHKKKKK